MPRRDGEVFLEEFIKNNMFGMKNVLDVGYGKGNMLRSIKSMGLDVKGIDPKGNEIADAETEAVGAESYNPGIDHYDCIYMLKSFHHLFNPVTAVRNINRMLAMKGYFIVIDWKAGGSGLKHKLHKLLSFNEKHYSMEEARNILEGAGFRIEYENEEARIFKLIARKISLNILFPIKDNAVSNLQSCTEYIITDNNNMDSKHEDRIPEHFDVLFTDHFGPGEKELNEKGVKVYYSRGTVENNLSFLKALESSDVCKWTYTCPVGKRVHAGEIPVYWLDNYCLAGNKECVRYIKESRNEEHSDRMLPDGTE